MSPRQLTGGLRETLALFDHSRPRAPLTTTEVAARLDLGRRSTYDRLDRLVDRGRLETKKVGASGRVWWRPGPAEPAGTRGDEPAVSTALADALTLADAGLIVLDPALDVAWVDATVERYFGFDGTDAIGRDARGVVHERLAPGVEDPEAFLDATVATHDGSRPGGFEFRVTAGEGRDDRWLEHRSEPIESGRYAGGRVEVYVDVTDRRDCERALRASERRNRALVDNFPDGIIGLFDDGLTHTLAGGEALADLDASVDDVEGRPIRELFPPALADEVEPRFNAVFDGEGREFEVEAGDAIWTFRVRPVRDRDGEVVAGLGVSRNASRRRRRERELQRYAGAVDAVGQPIYELDAEGRFVFVNEALLERSGYAEEALLGEHVSIWMDEEAFARLESRIAAHLADGREGGLTVEHEVVTEGGERTPVETRLALLTDEDGRFRGTAGVVRDVSARKARERELEESEWRYRTLVENFPNGAVVLFDEDLRFLTVGGEVFDGLGFSAADVEGERMPERLPAELLDAVESRYRAVFDGESSEFEAEFNGQIRRIRAFPVFDESRGVFAGMAMSQDVTRQRERERELEHGREQLAALNNLHEVVRGITDAVIEQSTREEIEEIVCRRLAESDSYRLAWIGEVDMASQTLTPRTEAGVEGYVDEITVSVDPTDERSRGPGGTAVLEHSLETTQDIASDTDFWPWREQALRRGFQSAASIPIVHEDTLYGVLNVYAERPYAFTDDEKEVIGQLGEIVGHAIAAVERKRALTSDEVVELGLKVEDVFVAADVPVSVEGPITLERAVPVGEGSFLVYGTATGEAIETVRTMVDAGDLPGWLSVSVLQADPDETRFRVEMTEPPVLSEVFALGGYVDTIRIEDGAYYVRVHLAPTTDVRRVVGAVEDVYPSVELLTHRQVTRQQPAAARFKGSLVEELTERQRSAVEAAYFAGYFDVPRGSTGEEVAASLGVSPPTFHHHLRKAQETILSTVLDRGSGVGAG